MVEVTVQVPETLAERIEPARRWLPTILELSLVGFRTPAAATAAHFIGFLLSNPTPEDVLAYHVPENMQERLRRLLALNEARLLSETEQQELDELEQAEGVGSRLPGGFSPT